MCERSWDRRGNARDKVGPVMGENNGFSRLFFFEDFHASLEEGVYSKPSVTKLEEPKCP